MENGFYFCVLKQYPDEQFKVKVECRGVNRTRITFPNGTPTIDECGYSKIYFTDEFLNVYKLLDYIRPINHEDLLD